MNLNEEKKTPLRDKDLNTKREMVIQYIFTASKTVSEHTFFLRPMFCCLLLCSYMFNLSKCHVFLRPYTFAYTVGT